MASGVKKEPCFTDFAIQEYLLGRLDAAVRVEVETHLGSCPECAACAKLLKRETLTLRAALRTPSPSESTASKINDETLASYLDNSLRPEAREEVELALLESSEALMRLNEIRLELEAVRDDSAVPESRNYAPEGRVLRMPKRIVLPRKVSDLSAGEGEAADG